MNASILRQMGLFLLAIIGMLCVPGEAQAHFFGGLGGEAVAWMTLSHILSVGVVGALCVDADAKLIWKRLLLGGVCVLGGLVLGRTLTSSLPPIPWLVVGGVCLLVALEKMRPGQTTLQQQIWRGTTSIAVVFLAGWHGMAGGQEITHAIIHVGSGIQEGILFLCLTMGCAACGILLALIGQTKPDIVLSH